MNVAVSPTERSLSWRRMLLVAVLGLLAPRVFAQAPSPADHRAQAVTQVVLGILSYARWPVEPAQLRLCIVGPTQYTDDLIKGTTQATARCCDSTCRFEAAELAPPRRAAFQVA